MKNISFFSYKGGSGRTSLLFNVLPILAKELGATPDEPIIVLDMDIDSKGLSYLIDEKSKVNTIEVLKNGDDLYGDDDEDLPISQHPFFKKLVPIGEDVGLPASQDEAILFVSAHATSEESKFLNGKNNFDIACASLKNLEKLCGDYNCKAIIMDTPSGGQLAGDAALSISNVIITVMRITSQFQKGTMEFLTDLNQRFRNKKFILVPNAIPNADGLQFNVRAILDSIGNRARNIITDRNELNLNMIANGALGINEVRLFKFMETNLSKIKERELQEDEQRALESYYKLVGEIKNV